MEKQETLREILSKPAKAYFIGIGGVGMSGLAEIMLARGFQVSGSDLQPNEFTAKLSEKGVLVHLGQNQVAFDSPDLIIYSSAISEEHIEMSAAASKGIPIFHRAEVLSYFSNLANTFVGITGTHGKTTSTAMISYLLDCAKKEPTCFVGSSMINFDHHILYGKDQYWVSEVDESDQSHELFHPHYGLITNLELDHQDHYSHFDHLLESVDRFVQNFKDPGLVVYCGDDLKLESLMARHGSPSLSYGLGGQCHYTAKNLNFSQTHSEFDIYEGPFFIGRIRMRLHGAHNVCNALGCIVLLMNMGFEFEFLAQSLENFLGTSRRLEVKLESEDLVIIDDYAHHPTEVKAVLNALQIPGRKLTAIFQPHRYSRTKFLYKEFAKSFSDADEVVITDIYAAGEENSEKVDANLIVEEAQKVHEQVKMLPRNRIIEYLKSHKRKGETIAFLGAGDIGEVADELASAYRQSNP